ncbi:MAG TPA: hypothetical protein VHT03_13435 [Rhizomicrobium sp.]|jgi:hypothetical protein|nr:hypothetical protein [Rhizomicrobium sp.]
MQLASLGRACAVLSLVLAAYPAGAAHPMPQAPDESSLSDGAAKIVAALRSRPDIDSICGGGDALRGPMREVVIKLMMSGEIGGNLRKEAESAADFLEAHCGQLQAASASAVGPSVSSSSR